MNEIFIPARRGDKTVGYSLFGFMALVYTLSCPFTTPHVFNLTWTLLHMCIPFVSCWWSKRKGNKLFTAPHSTTLFLTNYIYNIIRYFHISFSFTLLLSLLVTKKPFVLFIVFEPVKMFVKVFEGTQVKRLKLCPISSAYKGRVEIGLFLKLRFI